MREIWETRALEPTWWNAFVLWVAYTLASLMFGTVIGLIIGNVASLFISKPSYETVGFLSACLAELVALRFMLRHQFFGYRLVILARATNNTDLP